MPTFNLQILIWIVCLKCLWKSWFKGFKTSFSSHAVTFGSWLILKNVSESPNINKEHLFWMYSSNLLFWNFPMVSPRVRDFKLYFQETSINKSPDCEVGGAQSPRTLNLWISQYNTLFTTKKKINAVFW